MTFPFNCLPALLFAMTGNAFAAPIDHWCKPDERVVFACRAGAKTVSFCARGNLADASGALSYRFGKLAAPVELEVSAAGAAMKTLFSYEHNVRPSGFARSIRFRRGKIIYWMGHVVDVYANAKENIQAATVVVLLQDRTVAIACDQASAIDNIPTEMDGKGFSSKF